MQRVAQQIDTCNTVILFFCNGGCAMINAVNMVPLLEAVVSYIDEGVVIADRNDRVMYQNPAAGNLLGLPANEPLVKLSELGDFNLTKAMLKAAIDAGETDAAGRPSGDFVRFEERIESEDGIRYLEFYSGIVLCTQVQQDMRLILIRDRTEQRQLQAVMQSYATDFETKDSGMLEIVDRIQQIAPTNASVLLQGESGTGKTHLARMIHGLSSRAQHNFVEVNCAAIPESLIESELFGHVKGAFTGAIQNRSGRFQVANKGTLFLDEISEIPVHLQAKLLRAIQDQEFEMVGSDKTVKVDVRIITASNRDLRELVEQEKFRADLFYRVAVIPLTIPSLRDRLDDIPRLINHFCTRLASRGYPDDVNCTSDALATMMDYAWPGNVRELENAIEHGIICSVDKTIRPESLPKHIQDFCRSLATNEMHEPDEADQRREIIDALSEADGNKAAAAIILGIDRTTLWRRMQRIGIN